ncbi:MAG: N-6 DNA methylase, partial [Oscillospiraceae bacterium]|nr:N-6 DNA methylase [Oscillospiraceae bacterium]
MLFYGKDAEAAAPALRANLLTRDISGLGETYVTGRPLSWQWVIQRLLENGHNAVLARPDPERGPDAPYEIITESDVADYIPLGMELTIDGRRMKIDSVDYTNGKVSLQDMELKGWYPIFRSEPIEFVRTFVEEVQQSEEYMTAEMAKFLREEEKRESAAAEEAEAPAVPTPAAPAGPEQIEIDGGQIAAPPAPTEYRERTVEVIRDRRLPYEIEIRTIDFGPERHNFHITDDNLGAGGQKTKYQNNVAAIRTLKQIEAEGRLATSEEQEILSHYVGWGGIAQAFDPNNDKWAKEYAELKELLTPEEYESARSTVLNAHYTSPTVIKAIYDAVERMDFQPGNVLEPACGIGNFFGLLPESMSDARLYGVELDSLTGRIARQLYQQADITVDGFENTDHPDDFFDLAVGNVPFGEYHVHDKRYDKQNLLIHDYFITKTLDKVRPGGVVAFITSKGTMDKKNSKVREALAQKADLLGAIRLPNNAFKANAGTEVTTDILFFQKRDRAPEKMPEWVESDQTEDGIPLNRYYLAHPEMVLGKMSFWQNMYGSETETACLPIEGAVLSEQLAEAVQNIAPPNRELLKFYVPGQDADDVEVETIPADPGVRNFSFTMKGGKTYYRENSRMKRVELGKMPTQRVRGMIAIRDSARKLIDLQLNGASDEEVKAEQANLNKLYDQFTKKYGLLTGAGNRLAFNQDSSYPLLCSLEILDDEGNLERKADMFTKRTIQHHQAVTSVDTASEALAVSIGERACVDLGYMASLMGGGDKIPQIVEDLKGVIFKDPATGPFDINEENGTNWWKGWQTADEYLSGNVRQKLAEARAAAEEHPEFAVNAEALEKVQPKELTAAEINVRIGAPWVKPEYYRQFIFELLKTPPAFQKKIGVLHSGVTDEWRITNKSSDSRPN